MLNQGLVAYPYIETTTAPVAGGILEDEPRIDFSDGCGHLLLEPSRANLFEHSEYYGGFSFTNSSIETNSITSPEGLQNASSLIDTTSNAAHRLRTQYFTATSGSTYTASLFIKKGSVDFLQLTFSSGQFGSNYVWFNLTNYNVDSVTSGASATIEVFGNDWYKLTYTITAVAGGISYFFINPSDSTSSIFYTGSNSANLHLYGLQLEQDATYPTSYIPTYGVSQTRLRDSAAELSNDIISGATEFTWLFDNTGTELDGQVNVVFQLVCTGTALRYYSSQGGRFYAGGYFGEANAIGKLCVKYDGTTITMFKDGIKSTSTSSTNLGATIYLDELFTSNNFGTPIKLNQMLFFKTALSDDECIALTTI
jgi:hypothetical protein